MDFPRLVPCGDRALLVYLGDRIDPSVNEQVHALTRTLSAKPHPAVVEVTPSYHCLMVEYDPVRIRMDQLEELIAGALGQLEQHPSAPRTVTIPVHYGGESGPDLASVASHTGLDSDEIVRRHAAALYRVYALGFSPGFCYLGGLDPSLEMPRLAEPRLSVPGGSVGIGGVQTGIYPAPAPGGWQLIGRTPVPLFDATRTPPALLEPGDSIRFEPITAEQFVDALPAQAGVGELPSYREGETGVRVIQPGMATTLQDLGRRGYMRYGVPVAGAIDFRSLMIGNWLVSNRARAAALEITMIGPELEFTGPVAFCLTGAPILAELIPASGGSPVVIGGWVTYLASPGDRLRISSAVSGLRSYCCVAGGFEMPSVLGSLSEDLFGRIGPLGRPLRAGDWLPIGLPLHPPADLAGRALPSDAVPAIGGPAILRATRGPQADAFTPDGMAALFGSAYSVLPQSDRQGLRLQGGAIHYGGSADILSEPVAAGSIQVLPNGQPILLLGNRQTTGGYAKAAVVVYPDLAIAGQVRPGDPLQFQEVDVAEAHAIAWAERRRLGQIRRYLEREAGRHLEQPPMEPSGPAVVTLHAASPIPSLAASGVSLTTPVTPAAAPGAPRMFRVTIGAIEFEALVEEVSD